MNDHVSDHVRDHVPPECGHVLTPYVGCVDTGHVELCSTNFRTVVNFNHHATVGV